MATKTYEIEVINWQWQITKTSPRKNGDRFWFSRNDHPRIKKFRSMKAARAWLENNNFKPIFPTAKRPCTFRSPSWGMEARIVLANDKYGFFPSGSSEARWARR